MQARNYLQTRNPFGLSEPPTWFLLELYAQDDQAVIFASETDPVYRVARKAKHGPPMLAFLKHPDARLCRDHSLIPSISVIPTGVTGFSWARVLLNLQERDIQKQGGATEVADRLDAFDDLEEQQLRQRTADEAEQRGVDGYRLYKSLNGERVSLSYRKPEGAKTSVAKMRRTYRPVGAGPGAMFVGR